MSEKIIKMKLSTPLTDEETLVFKLLMEKSKKNEFITQVGIVNNIKDLGSYEKFEHKQIDSTKRKVRSIIRNLRLKGIPIISNEKGYIITNDPKVLQEFFNELQNKVRIQAGAYYHTFKTMKDEFEKASDIRLTLFDTDMTIGEFIKEK